MSEEPKSCATPFEQGRAAGLAGGWQYPYECKDAVEDAEWHRGYEQGCAERTAKGERQ